MDFIRIINLVMWQEFGCSVKAVKKLSFFFSRKGNSLTRYSRLSVVSVHFFPTATSLAQVPANRLMLRSRRSISFGFISGRTRREVNLWTGIIIAFSCSIAAFRTGVFGTEKIRRHVFNVWPRLAAPSHASAAPSRARSTRATIVFLVECQKSNVQLEA